MPDPVSETPLASLANLGGTAMKKCLAAIAVSASLWLTPIMAEEPHDILNVSYDVSHELSAEINKAFIAKYKAPA
jgi:sulfate transport system substrate-binding protein